LISKICDFFALDLIRFFLCFNLNYLGEGEAIGGGIL
jgi:hypothetical protein